MLDLYNFVGFGLSVGFVWRCMWSYRCALTLIEHVDKVSKLKPMSFVVASKLSCTG